MIAIIKTTSGGFNVIGTDDEAFILQGHLTRAQLEELRAKIDEALAEE